MNTIRLKPKHDQRIKSGHLWIFSNEIADNLNSYEAGAIVEVINSEGHFIGMGYVNPHSLISVRLLSRIKEAVDVAFLKTRIQSAWSKRILKHPDSSCYRVVFGESDFLPGLVIDKYGDYLVIQSLTSGMDRQLETITAILIELFRPAAIVARNDVQVRKLENLDLYKRVIYGDLPEPVEAEIEGLIYSLSLLNGQKTGFFLDQRENHTAIKDYVHGASVLDCFSYVGGWSLNASRFGAKSVIGLDVSDAAIQQCRVNVQKNNLSNCEFRTVDVFDELKRLNDQREQFDVIILDPPAFAKTRAEVKDAIRGYREINRRAAKALTDGGILITCSCSHVIDTETFRNTVGQGILSAGKNAILLEERKQARDHPILLSMRETQYLKCLVLQVFT